MVALIKALQLILALSILIIIHEFGHFIWAKCFGIRVEKFYLFFDIAGKHLLKFKIGETEFGIGVLPIGGYCKIAGMIDESLDLEQLKKEPQPWEFRSHPAWQRLLVMFGGVLNNFIFAIIGFIVIAGIWGENYVSNRGTKIYVNSLAADMGFRSGDEILMLDDYVPTDFGMLQADLARRNVHKVTILRAADTLCLYMDQSRLPEILNSPDMFSIALPFIIDSVTVESGNTLSGLAKGDRIVRIDGIQTEYLQDARAVFAQKCGQSVVADVIRDTSSYQTVLQVDTLGRIGVILKLPELVKKEYSALQAIPAGVRLAGQTIGGYLKDLRMLATPSTGAYKSVGSFIAIGEVMPSTWDSFQFLYILALLSIMLAVMNLIPIPGLDGGHIMFTLFEIITGRKPSERFLTVCQMIGMILLLALMLLAFGNDIGRLIH